MLTAGWGAGCSPSFANTFTAPVGVLDHFSRATFGQPLRSIYLVCTRIYESAPRGLEQQFRWHLLFASLSLDVSSLCQLFFLSLCRFFFSLSFSLRLRFGGAQRQAPCGRPVARAQATRVKHSVRSPRCSRQPRTRHCCCLGVRTLCGERQARQVVTARRRADCACVPVGLETFGPETVALRRVRRCAAASLAPPPTRRPRSTSAASSMFAAAAVQRGNAGRLALSREGACASNAPWR